MELDRNKILSYPAIAERSKKILSYSPEDLGNFYFPNMQMAIQTCIDGLKNSKQAVLFDIDDTLLRSEIALRWALSILIKEKIPDFPWVPLEKIIAAGGRYFQYQPYQNAASQLGMPFYNLFSIVGEDEVVHSTMTPHQGAVALQLALIEAGYEISGYITARPQNLTQVTAATLKYYGFVEAPVVSLGANSANPAGEKVEFFKNIIQPVIPVNKLPIIYFDDHVPTVIRIREKLKGIIEPMVPIVPRNKQEIARLEEAGIKYGTLVNLQIILGAFKQIKNQAYLIIPQSYDWRITQRRI